MFSVAARSLQHFQTMRREHGSGAACRWLVDRVGGRAINLGVSEVVWLELSDIQLREAPPAEFEFRFLTPAEVSSFVGIEFDLNPEHAARAAAGNDLCFAALTQGRLANYGWYGLGSIEAEHCDGVPLSFPADVAYMYKGYTHPDFRGRRLHGFAMRLALEALAAERGVRKLVSTVSWLNDASLKSCDRLGYRRLGRMVAWGWRPCRGGCYPAAARRLGVRFGRRANLSNREQTKL